MDSATDIIYRWDGDLMTYVALDGATYEEYNTKADFPVAGEEGIVYLSTSDNKRYSWKLVPGTTHYQTIAAQLTKLQSDYDNNIRPYNQKIAELQSEIDELNAAIDESESQYRIYRTKQKNLKKELSSYEDEKAEIESKITEYQDIIDTNSSIITEKTIENQALVNEYNSTTDSAKKAEIAQQIDNNNIEIAAARQYVTNATADLKEANAELAVVEEEILNVNTSLEPINEVLAPIDVWEADIQDTIDGITELQDIEQEKIDLLTEEYDEERAALLAQQGEYVEYTGESLVRVQVTDWRSELYLAGVAAEPLGLDSNYYYAELAAEWPKLYNLQASSYTDPETGHTIYTGAFYDDILNNPWNVDY
jgi:ACT domain-containing protein